MSKERELLRRLAEGDNRGDFFISLELLKEVEAILAQPESLREDLQEDLREEISLRDHFAGLAMQEFIALNNFKASLIVTMSYEMADKMLAEREKE